MSIFSNILKKIGLKKEAEAEEKPSSPAAKPKTASAKEPNVRAKRAMKAESQRAAASKLSKPAPISEVDVVGKLEEMAAKNPQELNWKVSIVDLLKLLDIDSSYSARKELATELGCPTDLMDDSASMNIWLHKTVLEKIAENGGNIPKELLD